MDLIIVAIIAVVVFAIGFWLGANRKQVKLGPEAHNVVECVGDCRCWDRGYKAGWAARQ